MKILNKFIQYISDIISHVLTVIQRKIREVTMLKPMKMSHFWMQDLFPCTHDILDTPF